MFDYLVLEELFPFLVLAIMLIAVGVLIVAPVAGLFRGYTDNMSVPRPKYAGDGAVRRAGPVEYDLVSGQPLGPHRAMMSIPLVSGVSAVVEVNAATVAGVSHRGVQTFMVGLKGLTDSLEKSGASVFVRLDSGETKRVRPREWYRAVVGRQQLPPPQPKSVRPSLPEWIEPMRLEPCQYAFHMSALPASAAGGSPEPAEGVPGDPSTWDIPLGDEPTPPYEEISVTFPEEYHDDYYEEIIIEEL